MVTRLLAPNNPQAGLHASYLVQPTQPQINYAQPSVGGSIIDTAANQAVNQGVKYGASQLLSPTQNYLISNPLTSLANAAGFNTSGTIASGQALPDSALFGQSDIAGNTVAGALTAANLAVMLPLALIPAVMLTEGTQRHETTTGGVINNGKVDYLDSRNKGFKTSSISDDMFNKDLVPALSNINVPNGTEIRIGYNQGKEANNIAYKLFDDALTRSGLNPVQQLEAKNKAIKYTNNLANLNTAVTKAVAAQSKQNPTFTEANLVGKKISPDGLVWNPYFVKGKEVVVPQGYITVTQSMLDKSKGGTGGLGWVMVKKPGDKDYTRIGFLDDEFTQAAGLKDNLYSKANAIANVNRVAGTAKKTVQQTNKIAPRIPSKSAELNKPVTSAFDVVRNKFLAEQQAGKA